MVLPQDQPTPAAPAAQGKPSQAMAQAIYLAQLAALKGNCNCNTCKIIRKMSDSMVNQFANSPPGADGVGIPGEDIVDLSGGAEDSLGREE